MFWFLNVQISDVLDKTEHLVSPERLKSEQNWFQTGLYLKIQCQTGLEPVSNSKIRRQTGLASYFRIQKLFQTGLEPALFEFRTFRTNQTFGFIPEV